MILNIRSPYFIEVAETGQIGSKIEIFIYNYPNDLPSSAIYTLIKSIPSTTQIGNIYNISPFIKEYIDNVIPTDNNNLNWAKVRIKRSKETAIGVYSLLNTVDYFAVNGYTRYFDGANYTYSNNYINPLIDNTKEVQYSLDSAIPFVNTLITTTTLDKVDIIYTDLRGRNITTTNFITTGGATISNLYKIPLTTTNIKYQNGNYTAIKYYLNGTNTLTYNFTVMPICEPKYTPVVCQFINRFGGWQFLTFFKAQTNSINIKGTSYRLNQDTYNYTANKGQSKSFNINGGQTVKLNTGWIPENYNDIIQDLLLSENVLLDGKPVEVKTQSTDLKTSLKDKNINYEIEFTYSFDLINNVI